MKINKSLIVFLIIFALDSSTTVLGVVAAEGDVVLGNVTSSDIDVSHTYSGAGSRFRINEDNSLTPVDVKNNETNVKL